MTTFLTQTPNQDSSGSWATLLIVVLLMVGLGLAYYNDVFTDSEDTTIEHTTVNVNVPAPSSPATDSASKQ